MKQKQSDTQSLQEKQQSSNSQAQIESVYLVNEEWKTKQLPKAQLPTYISEIIISPIAINVTFQMTGKGDLKLKQSALFSSIAQALGVALTDVSDAPIVISGWQLENCFDTIPGILKKMQEFYLAAGLKQLGKLIGSLSIIGNPISLFNNVSTGFKDFIDKPAAGLTQGPLEAGLGLAQGAGSLVSHTILGAINSVNKIAGSVSGGLANLAMDENYLRKREKMKMQKPKHIGEGLGQGAQSIMTGITDGIAGVFLKPIQETKEKGLKGVFTGTAKGFAGLIIKPITGVLDGFSQTAAGIQNTVQYFEDKPNNNRSRNIRPVYGYEGYITDFVSLDAEAYATLQFIRRGQLINNRFVASYFLNSEQDGYCMLVLTIEHFIYMSVKTKKKVWILASNEITHLEIVPSGLKIQVNKPQKQLKNKYITQLVLGEDLKYDIFQTMQSIWDSVKVNKN